MTIGIAAAVVVLAFGSDFLLSRDVVRFLAQRSDGFPNWARIVIERIERRQLDREAFHAMNIDTAADKRLQLAKSTSIYVATLLPPRGDTGVQTHFCQLQDFLLDHHIPVGLLTPTRAPMILRAIAGAARRSAGLFGKKAANSIFDITNRWLLDYEMFAKLPRNRSWTVYAQCPRSALTALRRRHLVSQQVVLAVHFNISQALEMADRGWIERDGPLFARVQQQEEVALLGVDRILYVSHFMRSCLVARIPKLAAKPSLVLPNSVITPPMLPDGPSGDIIAIGTLEPRKNQEFLLRVLAGARKRGKTYTLTLIGAGEDDARLKTLASELGISSQVTFAGFMHKAAGHIWRHRILAHAAKMENLPITLIEAMASERAVVAAPVGGIPEVLVDGVTGYFWDLEDVDASVSILVRLLEDEPGCRKMGIAGRDRFNKRFSTDINIPELYTFLQPGETLGNKPWIAR